MSVLYSNLKRTVTALALSVTFSLPLCAQEADETALLSQLAEADEAAALRIDRELQALWSKSGSSSMDLLMRRGQEAMEEGEYRVAIEHFTALTDHAPDFAQGWHLRAQAYYAADLYGPAVSDLGRALTLNPNNYSAIFGLGSIFEILGDAERAYEAYSRVKAMHPYHENIDTALERLEARARGQSL